MIKRTVYPWDEKTLAESEAHHVVFIVSDNPSMEDGLMTIFMRGYWPELSGMGPQEIGTTLTKEVDNKVFHAIVCYSFVQGGGVDAPDRIERYLDQLDIPDNEEIAILEFGLGMTGDCLRVDPSAIKKAMERSRKTLVVYSC